MHRDKVRFHCQADDENLSIFRLFPFQNPKSHILREQRWECWVLGDSGRFTICLFLSPKVGLCFLSWTEVGIWVPNYIHCCQGAQELWENTLDLERVTGRKARGLQMEEIGCKCQTFLYHLSGRRKQTSDIFFLLYTDLKGGFMCCHDTWFHLTILKPWVNQYVFFLMEMFVLRYVNLPQTL